MANLPAVMKSQKVQSCALIEKNGSCTSFGRGRILLSLQKCQLKSGDFCVVLLVLVCVHGLFCMFFIKLVSPRSYYPANWPEYPKGKVGQHKSRAAAVPLVPDLRIVLGLW